MKIIYTYKPEIDLKFGYRNEEIFLDFFLSSIENSQCFFDDVEVFIQKGCNSLKRKLPGSVEKTFVDYDQYNYDHRFWNFPKAVSSFLVSQNNESFLHVDLDFKFLESPGELNGFVCERKRNYDVPLSAITKRLPSKVLNNWNSELLCSGAFGTSNKSLISEYFNLIQEATKKNFFDLNQVNYNTLIEVEEGTLSYLINKHKEPVTVLKPNSFIHLLGNQKLML